MLKAIKIQVYPNKTQETYIAKLLGCYRFIYNSCLDKKIKTYTTDKANIGLKELGNFFHQELSKNEDYNWLQEHNTKVLKQSIINLLDSYKRYFVNGTGFPKFKSKHDSKQSCRFPLEAISKRNDYSTFKLSLTKELKNIKFRCSDKYVGYLTKHKEGIKSATLTRCKSGKYFLSILIDGDIMKTLPNPINEYIGIDLGIKDFIVTSTGEKYTNIKLKRCNAKKIAKLHRLVSKRIKGSKNRNKAKIKLAKLYERLNNIKQEYLHEISNKLLSENQVIIMENLNVKGMLQNHNLARSIQELSLYDFKNKLKYKAEWYGRDVVEVDRWFPSSKLCNNCGYKNAELTLKDREWTCPECGIKHDRDVNAAKNIEKEGKRLYDEKIPTRCGELTPLDSTR